MDCGGYILMWIMCTTDSLPCNHVAAVGQYQISLIKVVGMTWIQKCIGLYEYGIPFNVLRSPYWHEMVEAIRTALAGYKRPGYDKARTVGLYKEKAKIQNALGQFTNAWNEYGVSIVSDGWRNVKGKPLINVLGVSATSAVFLSTHGYSDKFKTGMSIAELLLKNIEAIAIQCHPSHNR